MPLVSYAVGNNLWLWSAVKGKKGYNAVAISAHGGIALHAAKKDFSNVTLHFYSEHGYSLNDPKLINVIYGAVKPRETIAAGKVQDYELTKYTNTSDKRTQHNKAGETYDSIGKTPEMAVHKNQVAQQGLLDLPALLQLAATMPDANIPDGEITKAAYQHDTKYFGGQPMMDIVTIRDRWWRQNLTLSEVIKDLWDAGFKYTEIHCSFCRSEYGGADQAQSALPAD